MPLADLTPRELDVVGHCLQIVAEGKLIKHDWEFPTLFGIEVEQLKAVAAAWPDVNDQDEIVYLAINNSLNHLLGLFAKSTLRKHLAYQPDTVAAVFVKWLGRNPGSYFNGLA
nr:hypothetical protein [uncultured Undibacterium sp.]